MKINVNNEQAVRDAIKNAEGRARTRTLSFYHIEYAVSNAEGQLKFMNIPRRYWKDSVVVFTPKKVANSYNGIPEGTFAVVTRFATGWFLTKVYHANSGSKSYGGAEKAVLSLSDQAKSHMPTSFEV